MSHQELKKEGLDVDSGSVEYPVPKVFTAQVYVRGFNGDRIVWTATYTSKLSAWCMARWKAWWLDITTRGMEFGIFWKVVW